MRRSGSEYEITGPDAETPKRTSSYGAALTYARNRAVRFGREATWYVRLDGTVVAHVTRLGDGVVETRAVRNGSGS